MSARTRLALAVDLSLSVLLGACGGGGGPVSGNPGFDGTAPPPVVPASTPSPPPATGGGLVRTLVWSDEFEGTGLPDATKWGYDTARNSAGWYNHELQYYAAARSDNSRREGGNLVITAQRERLVGQPDFGGQDYTSARLITRDTFVFTYGFVEVRARMPCSLGTWPAIWTLGAGGAWPADGEIDLLEQRGGTQADKAQVLGTVHTTAYNWYQPLIGVAKGATMAVADACKAFHRYQLLWTADQLQIGVDDVVYNTYANPHYTDPVQNYRYWPFDKPQYLILNLAMGGDLGGAVPSTFSSDRMEVDYVRVYQDR